MVSWISLGNNFPKSNSYIFVRFELRADWKGECETLADWDIWYYIG